MSITRLWKAAVQLCLTAVVALALLASTVGTNPLVKPDDEYKQDFQTADCTFTSTGEAPYYILKPGYQLVFEGVKDGVEARWVHTVLDRTETVKVPEIGEVETRAVEMKEWEDGELVETVTEFYAICKETGDVYDFGNDEYVHDADGKMTHEGSWRAGQPDADGVAEPGILVPGKFHVGAKYFHQMAEGYSMERGENMEDGLTVTSAAGTFENCVKIFESNMLEDDHGVAYKVHAPGVGLVSEDSIELVKYGYNIDDVKVGALSEPTTEAVPTTAEAPAVPVTSGKKLVRKITDEQARRSRSKRFPAK